MNRRFLTLAAIGVAVFAVLAAAMWFFMWRPLRFVDRKAGFSVRFSPEWEVTGEGAGATARAFRELGVRGGGGRGVINVHVSVIDNIPDAAAYRDWFTRLVAKSYPKYARIQEGTRRISGQETPWILFVYEDQDVRSQVWQFFFVRETKGYIISCTALPREFERFRAEFEEAVDSFRFE